MLDRAEAEDIAKKFVADKAGFDGISKVVRMSELSQRPAIYAYGPSIPADAWIAYASRANWGMLCSSTVAVIHPETGEVLYFESAGDEG